MSSELRDALLKQAGFLIRTRGYAAFSYADLAEANSIRKASVHHYFPKKEDLVVALVSEHVARFESALCQIEQEHGHADTALRAYAKMFLDGFEQGMLPLCGALSAERVALPESLQSHIRAFFRLHLGWLSRVVTNGVVAGRFRRDAEPDRTAVLILSTLEGGSFVAWALAEQSPVLSGFEDVLRSVMAPSLAQPEITQS